MAGGAVDEPEIGALSTLPPVLFLTESYHRFNISTLIH